MPKVTASKLSLLPHCGFSFRTGTVFPPDPMGPKARAGTACHALNEALLRGTLGVSYWPDDAIIGHKVPRSDVARVHAMHAQYKEWWESVGRPKLLPEVAFSFRINGRIVSIPDMKAQRGYDYEDGVIYGTADAIDTGDELVVYDVKTGRSDTVDRARVNNQIRFLGMCAARAYGRDSVRVVLQFIDEHGVYPDEAVMDCFDLEDFENWLCASYATIETAPPVMGAHCAAKYCALRPRGSWPGCPAFTEEQKESA